MSIESRIRALETLLDPGSDTERECQARKMFANDLSERESRADLPATWRLALTQARQALNALPPLPNHQCDPGWEEREEIRRFLKHHLVAAPTLQMPAPDAVPPLVEPSPPTRRGNDEKQDLIRWLAAHVVIDRESCEGRLSLDKTTLELWARFAPNVPFPWGLGEGLRVLPQTPMGEITPPLPTPTADLG